MTFSLCAPAKINFHLQVTGRREDGYHFLDSLVAFTDYGDALTVAPADDFSLHVTGPFAESLSGEPPEKNLVWRAAHALADHLGRTPDAAITLEKNLPTGAGLGGGSADAAAAIRGLLRHWNAGIETDALSALLLSLGSDVPVCYHGQPSIMRGTGDIIVPAPALPEMGIVLVFPGTPCPTASMYGKIAPPYSAEAVLPSAFASLDDFIESMKHCGNDFHLPAVETAPVIKDVLAALDASGPILLARLSGSGAACFGLCRSVEDARQATEIISSAYPRWWVRPCSLSPAHTGFASSAPAHRPL